jgi:hypothetical protein
MTLKELGSCDHVRRADRVIEFELKAPPNRADRKNRKVYHAICPKCGTHMRWDNWSDLSEPLRANCIGCGLYLPSTELNLQPAIEKQLLQ